MRDPEYTQEEQYASPTGQPQELSRVQSGSAYKQSGTFSVWEAAGSRRVAVLGLWTREPGQVRQTPGTTLRAGFPSTPILTDVKQSRC